METELDNDCKRATLEHLCSAISGSMLQASHRSLPRVKAVAKQRWISERTLHLIDLRSEARISKDWPGEKRLNTNVKQSVKKDRNDWLDGLLEKGPWDQIKSVRKGVCHKQGRLRNMAGQLVSSEDRAETLAEYLENVQWAVRPTTCSLPQQRLGAELPVKVSAISEDEVVHAGRRLKREKACGNDGLAPEFWKAICEKGTTACRWALELCQQCWDNGCVPEAWHEARVATLFKKGDVADCGNYRPISLLPIGYKLFANILLKRLKDAGAESRIWPTQFGFRSHHGTMDAIFLARRLIEESNALQNKPLLMLALDWAKAFDSICPDALCESLERFGIPSKFLQVVRAIYTDRRFFVSDAGQKSEFRKQEFGICQGCPLSPFLFGMLMTVLITDAKTALRASGAELSASTHVHELLYADDTLIIDADEGVVNQYMRCIETAGKTYGLAFNWAKLEVLPVGCACSLSMPTGEPIRQKDRMVYLGSVLSADGSSSSELNRRIGSARGEFDKLCKVWSHAGITASRKIAVFQACVMSKLLYNMHSLCLNTAEARKLDGFHVRCLRRILKIQHSYYSHVSNASVLAAAGVQAASVLLLERQLLWMGGLAIRADNHVLRKSVFKSGECRFEPKLPEGKRKRGRPKACWSQSVYDQALKAAGSTDRLHSLWSSDSVVARSAWSACVKQYCRN